MTGVNARALERVRTRVCLVCVVECARARRLAPDADAAGAVGCAPSLEVAARYFPAVAIAPSHQARLATPEREAALYAPSPPFVHFSADETAEWSGHADRYNGTAFTACRAR